MDLREGDEVYWNDPDNGICSGIYKIKKFLSADILLIGNEQGSEVEVFIYELS